MVALRVIALLVQVKEILQVINAYVMMALMKMMQMFVLIVILLGKIFFKLSSILVKLAMEARRVIAFLVIMTEIS